MSELGTPCICSYCKTEQILICIRLKKLKTENAAFKQQQKDDYATYLDKVAGLEKQLELTKTGYYTVLRKIQEANKILEEEKEFLTPPLKRLQIFLANDETRQKP